MGEMLVSLTSPMKDLGITIWIFGTGAFLTSSNVNEKEYPVLIYYKVVVSLLPYWFRIMQCIVRYKETKMKLYLVNVGKNLTGLTSYTCMAIIYLVQKKAIKGDLDFL
jgi:hypothetical protein